MEEPSRRDLILDFLTPVVTVLTGLAFVLILWLLHPGAYDPS